MAKGNIFMGTLKGRIGGSVFYVKQGEQNVVKHQTEVSNPKTSGQCIQRSKFAAAGKFYTHGTQALFKFAFESKNKGESDFNAFMRSNIDIAFPMSKNAIDNPNYPMINNWLVTRGSLVTPACSAAISSTANTVSGVFDIVGTAPTSITTVAELSAAIVDGVNYKDGDILTFLLINSYVDVQSYPAIVPDIMLDPQYAWVIKQIRLSSFDTSLLSAQGLTASIASGKVTVTLSSTYSDYATSYVGGTCVHSRVTSAGLKVSTNRLMVINNTDFQLPLENVRGYVSTEAYQQAVIATWQGQQNLQSSTEIILEGALVSKSGLQGSGINPVQGVQSFTAAKAFTVPFDPRSGYLTVTPAQLDRADAIQAANDGNLVNWYWNRTKRAFIQYGNTQEEIYLNVEANSNGTFSIWSDDGNQLFYYIKSWTTDDGQTVDFDTVGSGE